MWNSTASAYIVNNTTELRNFTSYERPFDEVGIIASAFIIFTFLIIGLIGNSLTIIVITWYKALSENVFMRFILSLCVSDLISALISWLFLYRRTWGFDVWAPLPTIFCRFYWAADIMTSYVTALHIFSFAILRFISIQFPIAYNKIKLIHGNIWMGAIWFVCFFAGFVPPFFLIFDARTRDRQSGLPDSRWPACTALVERYDAYVLYQKIGYTIFLYVPTIGVVVTCVVIVALVAARTRKATKSKKIETRQRKEKQAALQLVLIIMSFLLGYIPFTAYEFWSVQKFPNTRYFRRADYWFGMTEYFFLRFSECLNPLFYNLGSSKVRSHTKMFLKEKLFCCIHWKKKKIKTSQHARTSVSVDRLSTIAGSNLGV